MPAVNKDCRTCEFDEETLNCRQGHMRSWRHRVGSEKGEPIPIQDCHAWNEKKECICSQVKIFSTALPDIFDIVCRKCGRKKELGSG